MIDLNGLLATRNAPALFAGRPWTSSDWARAIRGSGEVLVDWGWLYAKPTPWPKSFDITTLWVDDPIIRPRVPGLVWLYTLVGERRIGAHEIEHELRLRVLSERPGAVLGVDTVFAGFTVESLAEESSELDLSQSAASLASRVLAFSERASANGRSGRQVMKPTCTVRCVMEVQPGYRSSGEVVPTQWYAVRSGAVSFPDGSLAPSRWPWLAGGARVENALLTPSGIHSTEAWWFTTTWQLASFGRLAMLDLAVCIPSAKEGDSQVHGLTPTLAPSNADTRAAALHWMAPGRRFAFDAWSRFAKALP